jgi:hypothetical protein
MIRLSVTREYEVGFPGVPVDAFVAISDKGTVPAMRHLGSLLASIVVAPVAWVLLAFGQGDVHAVWEPHDTVSTWPEQVAALAAAGLLLGLVASTRISPVGPVVAGAAFTGYGIGALWRKDIHDLIPDTLAIAGRQADLHRPVFTGTGVFIGALLLVAVLSVRRWQRWPKRPTAIDATPEASAAAVAEEERSVPEPEPTAVLLPEPEPEPTAVPHPEPVREPEPALTAAAEPQRVGSKPEPEPEPEPEAPAPVVAAPAPRATPEAPARPGPPATSPWSAPPRQAPR